MNGSFTEGLMQGYGFVDAARRNMANDEWIKSQRDMQLAEQKRALDDREFNRQLAAEMMRGRDIGYGANQFQLKNAPEMPSTGAQEDYGPGDSPVGLRPIVTRNDARTEEERAFDMSRAAIDFALNKGRGDVAMQLYMQAAPLREKVREQAINRGWAAYRASRDPNALLSVANRYVMDGANFEGAQPVAGNDGKPAVRVRGTDPTGRPFDDVLPPALFEQRVQLLLDPDRMRAAELQRLQQEAQLKYDETHARVTKPKDFVMEADPEKRVIALTPGGPAVMHEPGLKPQVVTTGPDQTATIVGGGAGGTRIIGGPQPNNTGPMSQAENKVLDDVRAQINSLMGTRLSGGIPATQADKDAHEAAIGNAGALMQANRGNPAADAATLANVALGLADGRLKPIKGKLNATGDVVDAVQLPDGRVIYTNPTQIRNAMGRANQRDDALTRTPGLAPELEPNIRGRGAPTIPTPGLEPIEAPPAAAPATASKSGKKAPPMTVAELRKSAYDELAAAEKASRGDPDPMRRQAAAALAIQLRTKIIPELDRMMRGSR